MFDVQIFGVSAVGAIVAIVTLLKEIGFPQKYAPVVSVILGILTGIFLVDPSNMQQGVVDGLALGLSAVGLFSGVKNVKEGVLNLVKKPDQSDNLNNHNNEVILDAQRD
jgi:uncharacterized membrane protein YadS